MILTLFMAAAATGQYRACTTAPIYQNRAAYVESVAYVAVDPYYSKVVGAQARQQAAAQADATLATQVGLLTAELSRLRQQLAGSKSAVIPPPDPIVPTSGLSDVAKAATAVLAKKCAACHTDAAKPGAGFKLLGVDGTLAGLTPLQLLLVDQKCYSGEMPPDPKQALTAEEYSSIRAWINESKDTIETALKGPSK